MSFSSSAVIWASFVTSAPKGRTIIRVRPVRTATTGARRRPRRSTGPASRSAVRSGKASASAFGTSSPMTIEKSDTRIVTITSAIASALPFSHSTRAMSSASPFVSETAATAAERKPMKVIAIWMTARNRPGSATRRRTRAAPRRFSSTSWSRRLRRSETRAISAATKMPASRVSPMTIRISVKEPIRRPPRRAR
jgi:hypothetical protein